MLSCTSTTLAVAETIVSHSVHGTNGGDPLVKKIQDFIGSLELIDLR